MSINSHEPGGKNKITKNNMTWGSTVNIKEIITIANSSTVKFLNDKDLRHGWQLTSNALNYNVPYKDS